jgi:hypothetical protein
MNSIRWVSTVAAVFALGACGNGGTADTGNVADTGVIHDTGVTTMDVQTTTDTGVVTDTGNAQDTGPADASLSQVCNSGLGVQTADCASCLGTNCCQQFTTCAGDMACTTCLSSPTGAGCNTQANAMAAETCAGTHCAMQCGNGRSTLCGSGLGVSSMTCATCINGSCCDAFNACLNDATCSPCLMSPTGMGCMTNMLYGAFNSCASMHCTSQCSGM